MNDSMQPGDTIVVPQKPVKPDLTIPVISNVTQMISGIASSALGVLAIITNLKL